MTDVRPQDYSNREQWKARRGLSRLLRIVAFVVPIASSIAVTMVLGRLFFQTSWALPVRLFWMASMFAVAIVVSNRVGKLSAKLLPLSTLCLMNLDFPKAAPSRVKTALRVGNTGHRERVVQDFCENGLADDPQDAAEQVLELIQALNTHDRRTRGHSERVRAFADVIAVEMKLSESDRNRLRWAAILHDIGKITVAPEILNKAGKPDAEEWAILKQHPSEGEVRIGSLAPWLGDALNCVWEHHERYDGTGYPRGLKGDDTAIFSRIVAVADSFEVMTSSRSYKKPMSFEDARAELVRCAGTHFDPDVVRAMLQVGAQNSRFANGFLSSTINQLMTDSGRIGDFVRSVSQSASTGAGSSVVAPIVKGVQIAAAPKVEFGASLSAMVSSKPIIVATTAKAAKEVAKGKVIAAVTSTTMLLGAAGGAAGRPDSGTESRRAKITAQADLNGPDQLALTDDEQSTLSENSSNGVDVIDGAQADGQLGGASAGSASEGQTGSASPTSAGVGNGNGSRPSGLSDAQSDARSDAGDNAEDKSNGVRAIELQRENSAEPNNAALPSAASPSNASPSTTLPRSTSRSTGATTTLQSGITRTVSGTTTTLPVKFATITTTSSTTTSTSPSAIAKLPSGTTAPTTTSPTTTSPTTTSPRTTTTVDLTPETTTTEAPTTTIDGVTAITFPTTSTTEAPTTTTTTTTAPLRTNTTVTARPVPPSAGTTTVAPTTTTTTTTTPTTTTTESATTTSTTTTTSEPLPPTTTTTAPPTTATIVPPTTTTTLLPLPTCPWTGKFYNNYNTSGPSGPVVATDTFCSIAFDYGLDRPMPGVYRDNFGAEFTGTLDFAGGDTVFTLTNDDGVRLWVDNVLQVDDWTGHSKQTLSKTVALTPGRHDVRLEYFEGTHIGYLHLAISPTPTTGQYAPPTVVTSPRPVYTNVVARVLTAGPNTTATNFTAPHSIAVDSAGNAFVSDTATSVIYKVSTSGELTVYAGIENSAGQTADGLSAHANAIDVPKGLVIDAAGDLIFAESGSNRIRKIDSATRHLSTIAGNGSTTVSNNVVATSTGFNNPTGLALDAAGNLFVVDTGNNLVRRIDASTQKIVTVVGGGNGTGLAPRLLFKLNTPISVAVTGDTTTGNLVVGLDNGSSVLVDLIDNRAATLSPNIYANTANGQTAVGTAWSKLTSMMYLPNGHLLVADSANHAIRHIDMRTSLVYTVAGIRGTAGNSGNGGPALAARFTNPTAFTIVGGNVWVVDAAGIRVLEL